MSSPEITALLAQAHRYRPTAVVQARRLSASATWRTDRGATMQAARGDWELTDDQGNRWTVEPAAFARTYRARPDGRYAKHEPVEAVQLTLGIEVPTTEGLSTAQPGDWLLRDARGAVWPIPDGLFRQRYQPEPGQPS